jgi:hypothetical protein
MNVKQFPSPNEAAAFEAGYLAATLRARREFTWAQRAAIIDVLTSAPPDPRVAAPETPQPALRSFALILARCESAAILLGWRREITPAQKFRLDAAIHQLQEAAAQVAVRVPAQNGPAICRPADPTAAARAKFSPLFRVPCA